VTAPDFRPGRRWLPLLAAGLLALATSASTFAASPSGGASSGSAGDPNRSVHSPLLVPHPHGDGATFIKPDPNVVDLHRQAWDHVKVGPNGKRLTVYFWMGIQDCYGLGRVHASRNDGQLKIQLWTGMQPNAVGTVCPAIAQLYKTVVHLHRPLIQGDTY
jgi:hypothetical protein